MLINVTNLASIFLFIRCCNVSSNAFPLLDTLTYIYYGSVLARGLQSVPFLYAKCEDSYTKVKNEKTTRKNQNNRMWIDLQRTKAISNRNRTLAIKSGEKMHKHIQCNAVITVFILHTFNFTSKQLFSYAFGSSITAAEVLIGFE